MFRRPVSWLTLSRSRLLGRLVQDQQWGAGSAEQQGGQHVVELPTSRLPDGLSASSKSGASSARRRCWCERRGDPGQDGCRVASTPSATWVGTNRTRHGDGAEGTVSIRSSCRAVRPHHSDPVGAAGGRGPCCCADHPVQHQHVASRRQAVRPRSMRDVVVPDGVRRPPAAAWPPPRPLRAHLQLAGGQLPASWPRPRCTFAGLGGEPVAGPSASPTPLALEVALGAGTARAAASCSTASACSGGGAAEHPALASLGHAPRSPAVTVVADQDYGGRATVRRRSTCAPGDPGRRSARRAAGRRVRPAGDRRGRQIAPTGDRRRIRLGSRSAKVVIISPSTTSGSPSSSKSSGVPAPAVTRSRAPSRASTRARPRRLVGLQAAGEEVRDRDEHRTGRRRQLAGQDATGWTCRCRCDRPGR